MEIMDLQQQTSLFHYDTHDNLGIFTSRNKESTPTPLATSKPPTKNHKLANTPQLVEPSALKLHPPSPPPLRPSGRGGGEMTPVHT